MTTTDELRQAAERLRDVFEREDHDDLREAELMLLLAETLETEARMLDMIEPFTELLNATVEGQGGPKAMLRLLQDDEGQPKLVSDTTPSWLRIARLINEGAAA